MKFSLLDFNTQGTPFFAPYLTLRYKKFCEIINKENPDIICFQEIATYYHLFLLKKYLQYPYFIYKKNLHGPKGGLVIVSKIPLENTSFVNFKTSLSFHGISFWSHIVKNGMLTTKIKNTDTTIINTHTFSDFEFDWSPTNKLYRFVKLQVEQITNEIKNRVDKKQDIILTGDFNLKKNSQLYKYLVKETKLTDVFGDTSFPTYYRERLDYKFKGKTSERIDFIFYKGSKQKLKILSRSHLFEKQERLANKKLSFLSDHIGLKVNFQI